MILTPSNELLSSGDPNSVKNNVAKFEQLFSGRVNTASENTELTDSGGEFNSSSLLRDKSLKMPSFGNKTTYGTMPLTVPEEEE